MWGCEVGYCQLTCEVACQWTCESREERDLCKELDGAVVETGDVYWWTKKPFIHIHGNVYMMMYAGATVPSKIKTYIILPDGTIMGMIDELVIPVIATSRDMSAVKVSQNIFAVTNSNMLYTYEISDDGMIVGLIDSLVVKPLLSFESSTIFMITDTVYGYYSDRSGEINTIGISADGTITGVIDINITGASVWRGYGFHVAGDVFAVVGEGQTSFDPEVVTIEILPDGTINGMIDVFFSAYYSTDMHAIRITKNMYATAGQDGDGNCIIHTVEIADDGIIAGEIDHWQGLGYDPLLSAVWAPFLTRVGTGVYAISYYYYEYIGPNPDDELNEGRISLIKVPDDGIIEKNVIDTLIFNSDETGNPTVVQVSNRIYAFTYVEFTDDTHHMKTFDICDIGGRIRFTGGLTHRPM
jgi:hypothetical protein